MLAALRAREARYAEVMRALEDPAVFTNPARIASLQKERGLLRDFHELLPRLEATARGLEESRELAAGPDPEMAELGKAEIPTLEARLDAERALGEDLLLADDGFSHRDVILEVRGATGGEEAALFARDLFRMYCRYAERRGWKVDVMDSSASERGGLKEVIAEVTGPSAYRFLRYESGGHRVQRVPETETQGRIHTSIATVAVMPKAEEVDVSWKPEEVRIDTMRAGGPGGQKVNKTESAVRMTHLPTGIVVKCQDEKSQHKNRARAEEILRSYLLEHEMQKRHAERSAFRKNQVGSGDRSEKIRTYNVPQDRITDHRAGVTVHGIVRLMDGELDPLLERIASWDRDLRLREMAAEEEDRAAGRSGAPAGS
ncbi:MAG: peptide chain release factor 1 [Planctomycetaceae bacterium]|nr:peptide chain release factor 1 [Planctomycetaceae bacterium]